MDKIHEKGLSEPFTYKHILEAFLNAYLVERNAEKTFSLVTDDVYSLGTGKQEVAHNKEELKQLIYEELQQIPEPITYSIDDYHEKLMAPGVFVCMGDITTCIMPTGQPPIHFTTRLTAGFRQTDGQYLGYHFHMSEASNTQEDYEFFPLHYGERESQKIDAHKQFELVELMKKMLPGGAMGGYVEPGFPLYFVNDELLNWLGYTYDEFIAENGQMMSNPIHPDDIDTVEDVITKAFSEGNEYSVEYRMRKKDHSYIWVRDIGRKIVTDEGRVAMISIIADISGERLRQQSFEQTIETMKKERRRVDSMTELLNREPAETLIEQHLIRERRGAFFLMDIDNFKLVNDVKGHPAGDKLLRTFADRMKQVFPSDAIVSRFGGDEFVAFVPHYNNYQELRGFAKNMLKNSEGLIDDMSLAQKISTSIGISIAPDHGENMRTLYSNADKGLYYAKRNGKNRYSFYEQLHSDDGKINPTFQTLRRTVQGVLTDKGAFTVEYETFNKICEFSLRNEKRLQHATQIVLFSLKSSDENILCMEKIRECKKNLEQAIRYSLRVGDLMMDFSDNQIAVLLVNCNAENAEYVAKRIYESYGASSISPEIILSYECGNINESKME